MQIKLVFILIAFFAMSAAAQTNKDEAAIQAVIQNLVTAQTEYDPKALDAIFTSDYIEISPAGEFDPRDKVLGFYKPELKPDPSKMTAMVEVTDYSIRSYGNFAIAIARFNYSMTAEGKPLPPRSIRATIVLKKEKADWKIASVQYTGIRPNAAQKTN
jgi:uncharacterized protein (TIGR02246 family)